MASTYKQIDDMITGVRTTALGGRLRTAFRNHAAWRLRREGASAPEMAWAKATLIDPNEALDMMVAAIVALPAISSVGYPFDGVTDEQLLSAVETVVPQFVTF